METDRNIFIDEGDDPSSLSCYFDCEESITENTYGEKARKITFHICEPWHLEVTILKSDSAILNIPDLELEEAPGTGRLLTIGELLEEVHDKLRMSSSYLPHSGPQRQKFQETLSNLHAMIYSGQECTLVLDDPLANTFIDISNHKSKLAHKDQTFFTVVNYPRTWEQNKEYGLLVPRDPSENKPTDEEEAINKFIELIEKANKIVAFTGAGISVESGVPAFRQTNENDLWSQYDISDGEYRNFLSNPESRARYWQMKTSFYDILKTAKPNAAHRFLEILYKQNKLYGLITQNIDNLHQASGIPEDKILLLHGTEHQVSCISCGKSVDRAELHQRILEYRRKVEEQQANNNNSKESSVENTLDPRCEECNGLLKPHTIFFGQPLDSNVLRAAQQQAADCDLMIVIGSSLVVQPANKLPISPLNNGKPLVIVTQSETQYDDYADLVVDRPCAEFFAQVAKRII